MKRLLFLFLALVPLLGFSQQHIVEVKTSSKDDLKTLARIGSIDYVSGNYVRLYLWGDDKLQTLENQGFKFKELPSPAEGKSIVMATTVDQMANWDRYPTYDVYVQMMQLYAQNYPDLCRLDTIGLSQEGRLILVLKISDNPDKNENEPEFFYTSTMHGDETAGFVFMLRLIDTLLKSYNKDPYLTNLVNNLEIWINPLSNPDGTYAGGNNTVSGAQRTLSNGVDPNRNFPDPDDGAHPDGNSYAPETQAMMAFAWEHNFTMSANFHGGAEVFNYPWDTWSSSENPHADDNWFEYVGTNYVSLARQINPNYMTDVESSGITEGYDWYEVQGGRQDYMNYWHHCREVTVELSSVKLLDVEDLPVYWNYVKDALLYYMEQSLYGFRGVLMDNDANLLHGTITVQNHDHDGSAVESDSIAGDYHRPIIAGNYSITASVSGFDDLSASITTANETALIKDFIFGGNAPSTNLTLTVKDTNNQALANIIVKVQNEQGINEYTTDANGQITIENVVCGTYKFEIASDEYAATYYWETVTPDDNSFVLTTFPVVKITGFVVNALTGEPIQGASIQIQNTSVKAITDQSGFYKLEGLKANNTYTLTAFKEGFAGVSSEITVSEDNTNNVDFALLPIDIITFEDSIPGGFSFGGDANWTRVSSEAYEGTYSMKSGIITDNQTSVMNFTVTTQSGTFYFYKKVSSEAGYDELKFYIDGNLVDSWSGEIDWSLASYNISAGQHTFTWEYSKDGSVSEGQDCAWVDDIAVPLANNYPVANVNFKVLSGGQPVQGAEVHLLGYGTKLTDNGGLTAFDNVYQTSAPLSFNVSYNGYDYQGSAIIKNDTLITVNLEQTGLDIANKIAVYPNPVSNLLYISNLPENSLLQIYNVSGKLLITKQTGKTTETLNISGLPAGLYILKIQTGKTSLTRKIIKN